MNGAQSLVQTLVNCGVGVCFGNPGTSEMHFVASVDSMPAMRAVLCLFEGVATGAADGYGRMAGKPAADLLHLRARASPTVSPTCTTRVAPATPIVNVVGDHATYHLPIRRAARRPTWSGLRDRYRRGSANAKSARRVAADAPRAVQAAPRAPGGIATLILPADTAWSEAHHVRAAAAVAPAVAARGCGRGKRAGAAQWKADRAAAARPGAREAPASRRPAGSRRRPVPACCRDTLAAAERTRRRPRSVERLPYFAEQIVADAGGHRADDPGRLEAPGVVLRLSGQAQLVRAGGLSLRAARPRARGWRTALDALDAALGGAAPTVARIPLPCPTCRPAG